MTPAHGTSRLSPTRTRATFGGCLFGLGLAALDYLQVPEGASRGAALSLPMTLVLCLLAFACVLVWVVGLDHFRRRRKGTGTRAERGSLQTLLVRVFCYLASAGVVYVVVKIGAVYFSPDA